MISKDEIKTEIDVKEDEESNHGEVEPVEFWQGKVLVVTRFPAWLKNGFGETDLVLDALY